jgi:DDE superfamily endonuclease
MMKTEFSPDLPWFSSFSLLLDSGFQGIDDLYQTKELKITFKRSRAKKGEKSELSPEQKQHNKAVSKERIFVEHAIGGLKRFRILYNRIRLKHDQTLNRIINVTAGLWNLYLDL